MFLANKPTNQADAAEVTGLIKQKRQPSSQELPEKCCFEESNLSVNLQ